MIADSGHKYVLEEYTTPAMAQNATTSGPKNIKAM